MKTILIHLILILASVASAQTTITGSVLSTDEQPLAFASVLLLQESDSSLVVGTITDADGSYKLTDVATGKYLLSPQMLGYQTRYRSVMITTTTPSVPQPVFLMETDAALLEEVVVKAQRPLFEHKIDRLVVNVAQTATKSALMELPASWSRSTASKAGLAATR